MKIRCMLYAARLDTSFWVEALLHATWLYNRQYHSAIEKTPFEAFMGRQPSLEALVTFGCKVTAKKPGMRSTTLDPHAYDGIFLGYMGTMDNIRYYDVHTGTMKIARHDSKDEVQYGDDPDQRSPSSAHLIEVFTGESHEDVGKHLCTNDEQVPKVIVKKDGKPREVAMEKILEEILESSPTAYTNAAAAMAKLSIQRVKFNRPDLDVLKKELDNFEVSTNKIYHTVTETVLIHSQCANLGLVLTEHPDMKEAVELVLI